MYLQIMTYDQAASASFNPFDLTKVWPHTDYPLHRVGRLVLNRNPKNYFAEVEQLAFSPSHLIPGVEPSPDKMLQARLFSYPDTHRHRLGANYQSIPVNAPLCAPANHYQRDGPMQVDANGGGAPNYYPNSFQGPEPQAAAEWHADSVTGQVERVDTGDEDNFSQCGEFFRNVLSREERERLTDNIAGHLCDVQPFIRKAAIRNFSRVDPIYGQMIEAKIERILVNRPSESKPKAFVAKLNPPRAIPTKNENASGMAVCPFGYSSKL
jgi:catalase